MSLQDIFINIVVQEFHSFHWTHNHEMCDT